MHLKVSKDAENLLVYLSDVAEDQFQRNGKIMSSFDAVTADGKRLIIPAPWRDENEKIALTNILRIMFRVRHVVRYGMISEVWVASYKSDEVKGNQWPEIQPRNRDDREEMVIINVVEPPTVLFGKRAIIRPWNGSKPTLGPLIRPGPDEQFSGRMVELLDD